MVPEVLIVRTFWEQQGWQLNIRKHSIKNASLMKSQDVLERVTVKAAEMLRINTGSLEAGKDADVLLIDLDKPNLTPTRVDNVMENLVWASDGSEVRWVISTRTNH